MVEILVLKITISSIILLCGPSSLGGGRILRRTLSVRLSVCPSVRPSVPLSLPSLTSRHLANYNDTHVLFGTYWGPHIVRPSRPHKFLLQSLSCYLVVSCRSTHQLNVCRFHFLHLLYASIDVKIRLFCCFAVNQVKINIALFSSIMEFVTLG